MTDEIEAPRRGRPPKAAQFPVKLLRKYRPMSADDAFPAGEEIELPIAEAKHVISLGIAERNDPIA